MKILIIGDQFGEKVFNLVKNAKYHSFVYKRLDIHNITPLLHANYESVYFIIKNFTSMKLSLIEAIVEQIGSPFFFQRICVLSGLQIFHFHDKSFGKIMHKIREKDVKLTQICSKWGGGFYSNTQLLEDLEIKSESEIRKLQIPGTLSLTYAAKHLIITTVALYVLKSMKNHKAQNNAMLNKLLS